MSLFNAFFDAPAKRPFQKYRIEIRTRRRSRDLDGATARGDAPRPHDRPLPWLLANPSLLPGRDSCMSRRSSARKRKAGRFSTTPGSRADAARRNRGVDRHGRRLQREPIAAKPDRAIAVRGRTIVIEGENGSAACFPPPHQFFFPRDLTDNQSTVWLGENHRGLDSRFGFGVRQTEERGRRVRPLVQRAAGDRAEAGDVLPALRAARPRTHSPRRSDTRTAIASPSFPATRRSPATGTWRSPWRPWRRKPEAGRDPRRIS